MGARLPWGRTVRRLLIPAVSLAVVCFCASVALACPSCRASLASGDTQSGGDLVAGYFWSILFMMSMPFTLLGTFSGYMYWQVRRARDEHPSRDDWPQAPDAD